MRCAVLKAHTFSFLFGAQVKAAVVQRFYDASISVRQAAVDLVGRFALLTPDLFERYFDALAERLVDRGVSVRARGLFFIDPLTCATRLVCPGRFPDRCILCSSFNAISTVSGGCNRCAKRW
jgi:hypothetical protein